MSKRDCYAILGLSPTAEDAVIRAAYLALMRSYHPDRNPSTEAAARVRAITEAYKAIGDPASRAEYDARRMEPFDFLDHGDDVEPPPRRWRKTPVIAWPKAPVIGAVVASALAIVLAVTMLPLTQGGPADMVRPSKAESPAGRVVATEDPAATPAPITEKRPSEPTASNSARPSETGPPQLPTALPQAEEALATPSRPAPVKADVPARPKRSADVPASTSVAKATPAKAAPVNEKARVAALEWQSTSFYNQSVNHADDARRQQLQQARNLFVTSRNACRSDSCVGDAHVSYMRDISRIMQKPKAADQ